MRRGELRHVVTLQKPKGVRDAVGERVTTWTNIVKNWPAKIEPLSGREQYLAAQRQASTTHQVTGGWMPQLAAMDASWRVLFGTRIFTIDSPPKNIGERNRELVLDCTESERTE